MEIKNVVVTGEPLFLNRHQILFKALVPYFEQLQLLPRSSVWYEKKLPKILIKGFYALRLGSLSKANAAFQKNKSAFILKSKQTEQEIRRLGYTPDLIFHVFSTYSPLWHKFDIPYVMYLDYTSALSQRNWSPWAASVSEKQRQAWQECQRLVYEQAKHLFCMSNVVKTSLIQDYGIKPQNITVVGSSGDFIEPYSGEKQLGSKQILFNGSDFQRKGGDLVLTAFNKVKQAIPEAKLVIIGKRLSVSEEGIDNPGHISDRSELHNLFLKTDLVVAPAYCDPFPTFLMEAMNYGIPCIVSANDGMPEIVDNEVNGIVIDQLTPDLLAERIINLLSNASRLASMSQAARDKVKTKLNWNTIANTIGRVLSS